MSPQHRCLLGAGLLLCASQLGSQVYRWPARYLVPPWTLVQATSTLFRAAGPQTVSPALRHAWTVTGLVLVLGLLAVQRVHTRQAVRPVTQWATRRQLRRAGVFAPHGVVLGRLGRRVLRDDSATHVLVSGPTRSGKTMGVVIPTLLDWHQSAIVYDPKSELVAQTAPWRQQFSTIVRCDPTSLITHGCNVLDAIPLGTPAEHRESLALIARLTDPDGTNAQTENATGKHFRELSNSVGQGLLLHALRCGHDTLPALATLLHTTPLPDLVQQMQTQPHPVIQSAAQTLDLLDGPQLSGLLSTLKRAFSPFLDPAVGRLVSRRDFALATFRQGAHPTTLYYSVPFRYQDALRPVTRLFFHTLFDAALASLTDWRWRLLVLLDEVTTLRQFPLLVDGFDFAAGYGLKLCLLVPSPKRLLATYGHHHNFLEGAHARLIFPPNTHEMATALAPEAGEHTQPRQRTSRPLGLARRGQGQVSTEDSVEPLLSATGLAQLPPGTALLLRGQQPPALVTTIRAYRDRPWKQRRTALGTSSNVRAL